VARDADIIRTADICDNHRQDARICEHQFVDYAARAHFHGLAVTFSGYETNKGLRKVLEEGGAGKVLVIDGRGSFRRALCGGNIAAEIQANGWEGAVINGVIRDSHEFAELDFGVKALGTTAMPPSNEAEGRVNDVVTFGGIQITPGDYIYADQDCVIVLDKPDHE